MSSYTFEAGSHVLIKPDIRSLDEASADLSYSWTIGETELSTDPILDIVLPPLDYGQQLAALTIIDNVTKMQYRQTFNINIVNSFNWGYYFLTRKDDGSTEMAYIQATKDKEPTMEDVKYATGCGDYQFGNEPSQLSGSFGYMLDSYYWTITILTREGEFPAIVTNNATFEASSLITEESFSDQEAGYHFKPEMTISTIRKEQYFLSDGQFIKYVKNSAGQGKLYRPAQHDKEYRWNFPVFAGNGLTNCYVFDELSHRYYVLEPYTTSDPASGIFADANALDKVVEISNNRDIEGNIVYAFGESYQNNCYVYSVADDGIHVYFFNGDNSGNYELVSEDMLPLSGLSEQPAFAVGIGISGNKWYTNSGNTIYASPIISPKLDSWLQLPADLGLGTIERIGFSAQGTRMIVVLYDENSNKERKGSVIFIDVETKQITHKFPNILHHCVDYLKGNSCEPNYAGQGSFGDDK